MRTSSERRADLCDLQSPLSKSLLIQRFVPFDSLPFTNGTEISRVLPPIHVKIDGVDGSLLACHVNNQCDGVCSVTCTWSVYSHMTMLGEAKFNQIHSKQTIDPRQSAAVIVSS